MKSAYCLFARSAQGDTGVLDFERQGRMKPAHWFARSEYDEACALACARSEQDETCTSEHARAVTCFCPDFGRHGVLFAAFAGKAWAYPILDRQSIPAAVFVWFG